MTTFTQAVQTQEVSTENGMKAYKGTGSACLDFFYKSGAMRGQDPLPSFIAAYVEDPNLALRILQWVRDIRGGAGERQTFRTILQYLETVNPTHASMVMNKIPEIGRFDDLFVFKSQQLKSKAYTLLGDHLRQGNKLAGKWTPRKGPIAEEIRRFFGLSYKDYRKKLVALTEVVESKMCANDWENINFSHVPSKAASLYSKAFSRHTKKYQEYIDALKKGDPSVKVNADAIFPHDVIKPLYSLYETPTQTTIDLAIQQWNALPNFVGDNMVLAMVDVSRSMVCPAGKNTSVTCLQVALSLGLYTADKNKGVFKDTFLTFSGSPKLIHLKGNIHQKLIQMNRSMWCMNTNIVKAFDKILSVAKAGKVENKDMPKTLLILSDMQFDQCVTVDNTAMQYVKSKYNESGYDVPNIVFWNIASRDNVPVKANESGAALVSGFSPAILKSILGNVESFTPENIMLETVMIPRYDLQ